MDFEELERGAELGGGEDRLRRQHDAGKLTARERIDLLFDAGSFQEVDKLVTHRCRDFGMEEQIVPGDGVVAGHGRIDGRPVYAFATPRRSSRSWILRSRWALPSSG